MTETDKKPTQKDRVLSYIQAIGAVPREDLNRWGLNSAEPRISDPDKRARELIAEGKLTRRPINDREKDYWGYNINVVVYVLPNTPPCKGEPEPGECQECIKRGENL